MKIKRNEMNEILKTIANDREIIKQVADRVKNREFSEHTIDEIIRKQIRLIDQHNYSTFVNSNLKNKYLDSKIDFYIDEIIDIEKDNFNEEELKELRKSLRFTFDKMFTLKIMRLILNNKLFKIALKEVKHERDEKEKRYDNELFRLMKRLLEDNKDNEKVLNMNDEKLKDYIVIFTEYTGDCYDSFGNNLNVFKRRNKSEELKFILLNRKYRNYLKYFGEDDSYDCTVENVTISDISSKRDMIALIHRDNDIINKDELIKEIEEDVIVYEDSLFSFKDNVLSKKSFY